MPFEFPGPAKPVEIDSDDAFAVMSAQVHGVIDAADELQDEIADAEIKLLDGDRRGALRHLREVSRGLTELLRVSRAQRRTIQHRRSDIERLPGADRALPTLDDQVRTAGERVARARQTAAEALNLYQSLAAEQLTRIATLLLPVTVVGGFFGMNFEWMVGRIDSAAAFFALGIGGCVLAVAAVQLWLRRTGA
jgi:Mg2+ and Co2+ transporter CorA